MRARRTQKIWRTTGWANRLDAHSWHRNDDRRPTRPGGRVQDGYNRVQEIVSGTQRAYDYYQSFGISVPNVNNYRVYRPEDETLRDAWKITDFYLAKLKHEVENNGGKLVIAFIPEYLRIAPDWERVLKEYLEREELPEGFDLDQPLRKFSQIAAANDVPIIQLDDFFRKYRHKFELPAPYFYYRCDGHLNPLGHFLAANLVARYLLDRGDILMNKDILQVIQSKVERNLQLSPQEILSHDGYDQIYKAGRFNGRTSIQNLR